jgi:acetolactate synthase-1/2/3 large subunit
MKVKNGQNIYMSAGHGSVGYSIPSAIGVYYATRKSVIAFCGDGGLMMNVQELQFISQEKLPVSVVCINNYALGMIRGFQGRNFSQNYQLTTADSGYVVPNLEKLATAFGFTYYQMIKTKEDIESLVLCNKTPEFIELSIDEETVLEPNFGRNGLIQDQIPYIDRLTFEKLMEL